MELIITEHTHSEQLQRLFESSNPEFREDCYEAFLDVQKEGNSLHIRGTDFFNGMSLLIIKGQLNQPLKLVFQEEANSILRFTYNMAGKCRHHMESSRINYQLQPNQGSMTVNGNHPEQILESFNSSECHWLFLEIDRDKYIDKLECDLKYLPEHYQNAFNPDKKDESMVVQFQFSIDVMDVLEDMIEIEDTGIVRRTNLESLCIKLFGAQVKQYQKDANNPDPSIKASDRTKLIQCRKFLRKNYNQSVTIAQLSQNFGLNQQKLKVGFKKLFGYTINKYVQKLRLEKARLLLSNSDINVSEAAHMVGYVNKSYFSRKFEQAYGLTPKKFQSRLIKEIREHKE